MALVWIVLHGLDIYTRHGESVTVPDVKRMQAEDAKALLSRYRLRSEVIDSVYVDNIPRGAVVEQIPRENSSVKENRIVFLTINSNLPRKYVASEYKDLVLDVVYNGVSVEKGLKLPVSSRLKLFVGNGTAEIIEDSIIMSEDSVGEEWME